MDDFLLFLLIAGLASAIIFLLIWKQKTRSSDQIKEKSLRLKDLENQKRQWIEEKNLLTGKLEDREDQIKQLIAQRAGLENSQKEKSVRIDEYKKRSESLNDDLNQANKKIIELESDKREQQTRLKAEREKLEELKSQFEKQKGELKNEFKLVSEEIIEKRQKVLNERNRESVESLLKPLEQQIEGFKKRINEVHTEAVKGNTSLEAEIKKVMEVGLRMRDEASNLTSALKGNSQKRGAWGEAQLERTLQISGLVHGDHYEKQSSFKDEKGNRKQTDYLINLPDNKHIIIDSKVSLIAYDRAVAAKTETERLAAMDEYVRSVKKHINDLASKDYANLNGIHSPSFVLMFMPVEPAYIEALKHDKTLFGYGYDKNIILLSHTTLIPILRTVSNLWVMDESNKEARKISEKAGDIYNAVCSLSDRFLKLGNTLNAANNHYNDAVRALTGRQGLQGKVEHFTKISKRANKNMPPLEPRHFQCDINQLEMKKIQPKTKDFLKEKNSQGFSPEVTPTPPGKRLLK